MAKARTRMFGVGVCGVIVLTGLVLFSAGASKVPNSISPQPNSLTSLAQPPAKSKEAKQQEGARALQEFHARFPTIDYDSPEPTNPEEKAKRRKRNKHYDRKGLVSSNPYDTTSGVTEDSEVFYNLPALPVAQSDVILTASVLNSSAHLSNDKMGVYSEFNVQVDAVLKGPLPSSQTSLISVSRLGGVVRYPSGQKVLYEIAHQNMPAIGKRYLFFLKATDDAQAYEIATGYEIDPQRVQPLDYGEAFESHRGTDTIIFMNTVRQAIAGKN